MICLIILFIISCQSTNYYELNGLKNEFFTRKQRDNISNISNHRVNNRTNNHNEEKKMTEEEINEWFDNLGKDNKDIEIIDYERDEQFMDERVKEKEVSKLENMNELITVIGSAIAGVYCAIKAIINAIKSLKTKKD